MVEAYALTLLSVTAALLALSVSRMRVVRFQPILFLAATLVVFSLGFVLGVSRRSIAAGSNQVGKLSALIESPHASAERLPSGLPVKPGQASIDSFDVAPATGNHLSVTLTGNSQLSISGWAADPEAAAPCKALYITVRDEQFPLIYGYSRADVASRFNVPAYTATGFGGNIPSSQLPKGVSALALDCLAANEKAVFVDSNVRQITVK